MASKLTGGIKDEAATPAEQLAAYVEASKRELAGVKTRLAAVDEKKDPTLHGRLAARVAHIEAVIKKAGAKLPKEQAVVDDPDVQQATA